MMEPEINCYIFGNDFHPRSGFYGTLVARVEDDAPCRSPGLTVAPMTVPPIWPLAHADWTGGSSRNGCRRNVSLAGNGGWAGRTAGFADCNAELVSGSDSVSLPGAEPARRRSSGCRRGNR